MIYKINPTVLLSAFCAQKETKKKHEKIRKTQKKKHEEKYQKEKKAVADKKKLKRKKSVKMKVTYMYFAPSWPESFLPNPITSLSSVCHVVFVSQKKIEPFSLLCSIPPTLTHSLTQTHEFTHSITHSLFLTASSVLPLTSSPSPLHIIQTCQKQGVKHASCSFFYFLLVPL